MVRRQQARWGRATGTRTRANGRPCQALERRLRHDAVLLQGARRTGRRGRGSRGEGRRALRESAGSRRAWRRRRRQRASDRRFCTGDLAGRRRTVSAPARVVSSATGQRRACAVRIRRWSERLEAAGELCGGQKRRPLEEVRPSRRPLSTVLLIQQHRRADSHARRWPRGPEGSTPGAPIPLAAKSPPARGSTTSLAAPGVRLHSLRLHAPSPVPPPRPNVRRLLGWLPQWCRRHRHWQSARSGQDPSSGRPAVCARRRRRSHHRQLAQCRKLCARY